MILIIIIVLIVLILSSIIFIVYKKSKKSKSTKSCKIDSDCGNNMFCVNEKCCSSDCSNKSCSETNDCGQLCGCPIGKNCFQNNCCTPQCPGGNTCDSDGCGGYCPCDKGYSCYTGTQGNRYCCQPPDCTTGFCGSNECGSCECQKDYCQGGDCCESQQCQYTDICLRAPIIGKSWANFCNNCQKCDLLNPTFFPGSFIPVSGTISCQSCNGIDTPNVTFDKSKPASYYYYNKEKGVIAPEFVSNYCKDSSGNCNGSCVCIHDDDCKLYGCTTCTGGSCN